MCGAERYHKDFNKNKILAANKKINMTFVEFENTYDSIEMASLIKVLKEFRQDDKTTALIQQT